jgi:hypothetical protein
MKELKVLNVLLKIEQEVCAIGSHLDGRNLYDLIKWHDDMFGCLILHTLPRIGEVIRLDGFWFEVTGIMHDIHPEYEELSYAQTFSIRVKQIPLDDPRTKW